MQRKNCKLKKAHLHYFIRDHKQIKPSTIYSSYELVAPNIAAFCCNFTVNAAFCSFCCKNTLKQTEEKEVCPTKKMYFQFPTPSFATKQPL